MIQFTDGLLSENMSFKSIGGTMPAVGDAADFAPTAPIFPRSSCSICDSLLDAHSEHISVASSSESFFFRDLSQNVFPVDDGQEALCLPGSVS